MSVRVTVRPLHDADAIGVWDSGSDTHLLLIAERLNLGQKIVIAAHLADQLRGAAPDAGIHFGVGEVTAASPSIAHRELVDLMDRRALDTDDVAAVLHHLFPDVAATEGPPPWHTSGIAP